MIRTFEIEWPDEFGEQWLTEEGLKEVLHEMRSDQCRVQEIVYLKSGNHGESILDYIATDEVIHGKTCIKAIHTTSTAGHYHDADFDEPFSIEGFWYCGRCHQKV